MSRKDLGKNPYGEPKEKETLGDRAAELVIYGMDKVVGYLSKDEEQSVSYLENEAQLDQRHGEDLEKVAERTLGNDD